MNGALDGSELLALPNMRSEITSAKTIRIMDLLHLPAVEQSVSYSVTWSIATGRHPWLGFYWTASEQNASNLPKLKRPVQMLASRTGNGRSKPVLHRVLRALRADAATSTVVAVGLRILIKCPVSPAIARAADTPQRPPMKFLVSSKFR